MNHNVIYKIPNPLIDEKESQSLYKLTERYNKIIAPKRVHKIGTKFNELIPHKVKAIGNNIKNSITEQQLFTQAMKVVAEGFDVVQKTAAKTSLSESYIVNKVNNLTAENNITSINEVCLSRSYDISKLVSRYKTGDLGLALIEGGVTGAFGFAGLPFNLVLSTFIYYRAVQSIAMYYGYDVKNDSAELIIASDVFINALSPKSKSSNEITDVIGKILLMTELTAIKQTAQKSWSDMATRGGLTLLITQMRALANKSAQKALEKTGQKGLEESLFKGIFEQIGKKLTKKSLGKSIPFIGGIIGALFDTAQMNVILEYADVFYNKRYLLEKNIKINQLIYTYSDDNIIIDITDINS
ncbi:EcsC family protein [Clostridium sp. YIM B02506]|uniref:EcsC family protein n=1 Tax=Clostridium sp. YIM B02506 TaxID=2910680 RepID=UPI001EED1941|nr:EcsC family protein [Clostridium sp. YIM B02506]